jgi:hypothetical protein
MPARRVVLIAVVLVAAGVAAELSMGRLLVGPDGRLGLAEWNVWSREQSQRLIDPYSFSHVLHGVIFYAAMWMVARRQPQPHRLLLAIAIEVAWEVLENSPIVIDRYREETMALGYTGDSVVNSISDVVMMAIGYGIAWRVRPAWSVALVAVVELGMLWAIRDNLTLNILMLVHPIEGVREWQMAVAP